VRGEVGMGRKPKRVNVMRTDGSESVYDNAKLAAKYENIKLDTVYSIIKHGFNIHGDKYEYVR
jgi:hypothetical protein